MESYSDKYRPRNEKQILGESQIKVVNSLLKAVKEEKLLQKILISGPSGTGKTTIARIYVQSIIGEDVDLDSNVLTMNGGAQNKVDDIREMVIGTLGMGVIPPLKHRIFFINEIHGLTSQAQEALLDEVEFLPNHVIMIGTTTDPQKLKDTLRSRFREFKLSPLSYADFKKKAEWIRIAESRNLNQELTFNPKDIDQIIANSNGNVRRFDELIGSLVDGSYTSSESLLEDDTKSLLYQMYFQSPNIIKWFEACQTETNYNSLGIGLCSFAIKALTLSKYNQKTKNVAGMVLKHFGTGLSPYTSEKVSFHHKLWLIYNEVK